MTIRVTVVLHFSFCLFLCSLIRWLGNECFFLRGSLGSLLIARSSKLIRCQKKVSKLFSIYRGHLCFTIRYICLSSHAQFVSISIFTFYLIGLLWFAYLFLSFYFLPWTLFAELIHLTNFSHNIRKVHRPSSDSNI